jgi:hypothetical protein
LLLPLAISGEILVALTGFFGTILSSAKWDIQRIKCLP